MTVEFNTTAQGTACPPIEFYSSVGGAAFLEGLLNEWSREGRAVTRCHALTESEYRGARTAVGRWGVRWKMYGHYVWTSWRAARRGRRDDAIRVVTTNPFYAPAWVQRTAKRSGATINLLYDLYPDALIRAGALREHGWLARQCEALTRRALRECDATVFLGERLRRHAEARYGPARVGVVIPVGADGAPFRGFPPQPVSPSQPVRILYAGQMGRMHDAETIAGVLEVGVPEGIELIFHSAGAGYTNLRKRVSYAKQCHWGGPLKDEQWRQIMSTSAVALVTMVAGAENIVMPSKTYAAMVAGQAVVAVCPSASDLADLVRKHDCGWVVEPGDTRGLRLCLAELSANPALLHSKRLNAHEAGHRLYDQTALARQWEELFGHLTRRLSEAERVF